MGNQHQTGPGFGKRPFGKEPEGKTRAERQRTKIDPMGEQNVTWSGPAENSRGSSFTHPLPSPAPACDE